jgi:hypothetical protein
LSSLFSFKNVTTLSDVDLIENKKFWEELIAYFSVTPY